MNSDIQRWNNWQKVPGELNISSSMWRSVARVGIISAIFLAGIVGVFINATYTLRIALGSIFMLIFLRYRYSLLIVWLLTPPIIGIFPVLANNNVQTILTVPTLLLLTRLPVKQAFRRMPALYFLFGYLIWVLAGIVVSPTDIVSSFILWISYLNYLAVAVLTIGILVTKRHLMSLIDIILLGSAFIALFGIYGYFTHQNGILDQNTGQFRIVSLFGSAPTLALFLSIVIPLGIYSTLTAKGIRRYCSFLLVLILLMALGLTFTRSAFISVPLSLIIMVFFLPSRKMKLSLFSGMLVLALFIIVLATLFNFPLLGRFLNEDLATLNGRTVIWNALLNNFDPLQVLGKGLNASGNVVASLYITNGLGGIAYSPHNLFLGTLYDHGIIGLILLTVAFLLLGRSLIVRVQETSGNYRVLYAAAIAILVSVIVQGFETDDILSPGIAIYFWISMALPFALCWSTPDRQWGRKAG